MARREIITCDRCGVGLHAANWYFDSELCNDCESKAELAATVARADVIKNHRSGTELALMLENYCDPGELPEWAEVLLKNQGLSVNQSDANNEK